MAGTAAKSFLITYSQHRVMNQFSLCHKKTQMKPRWPNSDAGMGSLRNTTRLQVQSRTCPRAAESTERGWDFLKCELKTKNLQPQMVNFTHAKT